MNRDKAKRSLYAQVTKGIGRFLAYCSIMHACRHDRRLQHGAAVALILLLPEGADEEDFRDAAVLATREPKAPEWHYSNNREKVVAAWEHWGKRKAKARDLGVIKQDRLIVLARSLDEVPTQVVAAVDEVIGLERPTARQIVGAVRVCLGQKVSDEDAAQIAVMPLSLIASTLRRGRPVAASLQAMRAVQAQESASQPKVLKLSELYGLGEAGRWGEELAVDLRDWRDGSIAWSDVDRGVLVSGAPGTGKTTFARALATTCDMHLVLGSLARWQAHGHLGDLLKAMRAAFAEAREKSPSILFIDEIDAVGDRQRFSGQHAQYCSEVVSGLLECIDGAERNEGVVIVGACNDPDRLDEALVRPGRLDRHVRIDLPDEAARLGILRWHLGDALKEANFSEVASRTEGWSGAGIEQLVRDARRRARRQRREIVVDDLLETLPPLQTVPPNLLRRTAIHEIGHAVVASVLGRPFEHVRLRYRSPAAAQGYLSLGSVRMTEPPFQERTSQALLDQVCVFLGGTVAEEVLLDSRSAGSGGFPNSDLHRATLCALRIEASYGLGRGLAFLAADQDDELLAALHTSFALRERVEALLATQMDRTRTIVDRHRAVIELAAAALLDRGYLTATEVGELIGAVAGADDASPTPPLDGATWTPA